MISKYRVWEQSRVEGEVFLEAVGIQAPVPRTFLDAGGELSAVLSGSIHRCIAVMELGEILEVISHEPSNHQDIVEWCRITGHELVRVVGHEDATLFWIRKR